MTRRPTIWLAATVLVLDQVVKMLVRPKLGLYESVPVIHGFFSLTQAFFGP